MHLRICPIILFSSYVLSMTALDRFLVCFCNISFKFYSSFLFGFQLEFQAICFPLTNLVWISRKQHLMIAIAWIVSIILCIPQVRKTTYILRSGARTTDTQWRHKDIWKIGPMWQTKYASAEPKNLGVGVNFRPCSEGYFLSGRP